MIDFPLIYCNGDSYSNQTFHPSLENATYAHIVGDHLNGFVMEKSINRSCNRRIIRTTVSDLIIERKLNPSQKIIALLGLTFELRSEIWVDNPKKKYPPEESNLRTHAFSSQIQWRENLLNGNDIETTNAHGLEEKFFRKYSEGRAFFYSPYAERINLLCDLVMLRTFLDSHDIKFLIFQCPVAEQLKDDFLLDQFKNEIKDDPRFFDLETFGFLDWSRKQGFIPLDYQDRPDIGHYGPDAHKKFAEEVLLPKLKETGQI